MFFLAMAMAAACLAASARGEDATPGLLKLVPADARVALAVADLRGHAATIAGSPLGRGFVELPVVARWRASEEGRRFEAARAKIEAALGARATAIRDELLGDGVVLSLHYPAEAGPEAARGLLLARVRDRDLLLRLIALASAADGSEVARVDHHGVAYSVRRPRDGAGREADAYCLLDDGTFAWSNSEPLIRGVLDRRKGAGPGLADSTSYKKVRAGLPSRSLGFVFVDPRFVLSLLAAPPRKGDPGEDRATELVGRYLRTVEGIGLALEWRDGFLLHSREVLDRSMVDDRWMGWAKADGGRAGLSRRIPSTAVAAASASVDVVAAYDALVELVPSADRPRLDTLLEALKGMLLGRSLRSEILPRVGPAIVAYAEEPAGDSTRPPLVGVVELRDDGGEHSLVAAIDNAIRTVSCLYALDPRHQAAPLRLESRQRGALRVTSFGGPDAPFAYGLGPDCLVVGTSADAVARFGSSEPDARLSRARAAYFPDARVHAALDVARVVRVARSRREALARNLAASRNVAPDEAARDLDGALDLLGLLDTAFASVVVDPASASIHQTLGLIGRPPAPAGANP